MTSAHHRVVVITGATAGIGRAVALVFARHGWRVAVIARDGLETTCQEIEEKGGIAMAVCADVSDAVAVFTAADQVMQAWGSIDVWVNNAMETVFAPVNEITPAEFKRITEVTYLGYVFGTLAALKHMQPRNAGMIVQVGSALSYRAIPLQSAYCGAKFAIRGFTDSLRSELTHQRSNIGITMVQLPAVNTPQFDWGRNKLTFRSQPVPPIYQPEAVAEEIFAASQRRWREAWVGFQSAKVIMMNILMPGILDRVLSRVGYSGQITAEPKPANQPDNLFAPVSYLHRTHGRFDERARTKLSSYHPAVVRGVLAISFIVLIVASFLLGGVVIR